LTIAARLRRLEERLAPPQPSITIEQWCGPEGRPCVPPEHVRALVEQEASGCWRLAVWAPDHGCAVLLGESDEVQIVEL
jgi:hypothetical protein